MGILITLGDDIMSQELPHDESRPSLSIERTNFNYGMEHFAEGDYQKAAEFFRLVLDLNLTMMKQKTCKGSVKA